MTNWYPEHTSMYEDVQTVNQHMNDPEEKRLKIYHRASRDSARTPVQWTAGENAGFSEHEPWFYVNENYKTVNVESEERDPESLLNFYRKAVGLRKSLPVIRDGKYREYRKLSGRVYLYERYMEESSGSNKNEDPQRVLVMVSFSDKPEKIRLPKGFDPEKASLLLGSYPEKEREALQPDGTVLFRPYEARVYGFPS